MSEHMEPVPLASGLALPSNAPHAAAAHRQPSLSATLVICFASQVLSTSSVLGLAAITPFVASSLSIKPFWIGYQVSLVYFAGIFASAIAGGLIRRWGAARVNQIALYCAGFGVTGLSTGIVPLMMVSSMLIGIGYAFNNPCSSHLLHRLTPAHLRNVIFSVKQAGVPGGALLAALVLPPLAVTIGWQWALLSSALPPLVLGTLFGVLRHWWDDDREPKARVAAAMWHNQALVWSNTGLRALAILGLVYSAIQLCLSAFIITMLVVDFGWTPVQAGTAAAVIQVCGGIGRVLWGVVADALHAGFLVLAFLGLATGVCCLILGLAPLSVFWLLVVLCMMGLCAVGWNGVMLAETAHLSSRAAPGMGTSTLTGDVLVYTFLGVVLGPSLFARLYEPIGSYAGTFVLFSIPAFAGTVLAMIAHRSDRQSTIASASIST